MATVTKFKPYTFEDFCFLVKDGEKADLIDGVIYMTSPDNTDANDLFLWLIGLMRLLAEVRQLGKVLGCRVALRLDGQNGPEPDILFIRLSRSHLIKRGHIDGPADLVMEIVSLESIKRDYETKRKQYERARVPEYWIVDELKQTVTLLRLSADGKYRQVRPRNGKLHSQAMAGFWIRPEWLWQRPFPNTLEVLRQLLPGENA